MTPALTSLHQPTRLERLQALRARLHEAYPGRRDGFLQGLLDVCIEQELELLQLRAQLGLDGP